MDELDRFVVEHLTATGRLLNDVEKADKELFQYLMSLRSIEPEGLKLEFGDAMKRLCALEIDRDVVNTAISHYATLYREIRKVYSDSESIRMMDLFMCDYGIASLLFRDEEEGNSCEPV